MYAVEKLSSYITRGVYTVSGPFHPFGGAVDIIVVQQQDGSFKSSPWYVRFGKFQGVLKTREKVVTICVNGVEAGFHMYLDHKGEAYFLKDCDLDGAGDFELTPPSSGDEFDDNIRSVGFNKVQSCNNDGGDKEPIVPFENGNGKIVSRTSSKRSRLLRLMFGSKSMKENDKGANVQRVSSLESAEIAADLLETRWLTNLPSNHTQIDNPLEKSDSMVNTINDEMVSSYEVGKDDSFASSIVSRELFDKAAIPIPSMAATNSIGDDQNPCFGTDGSVKESIGSCDEKLGDSLRPNTVMEVHSEETITQTSTSRTHKNVLEVYTLKTGDLGDGRKLVSESVMMEADEYSISSKGPIPENFTDGTPNSVSAADGKKSEAPEENHDGGKEVSSLSCIKTSESLTVNFEVCTPTHNTLNILPGGDHDSEVACKTSEHVCELTSRTESEKATENENCIPCRSQDSELSRSKVFRDSQNHSPSNVAFQDTKTNGSNVDTIRMSCSPEPKVMYQERETIELSQVNTIKYEEVNIVQNRLKVIEEATLEPTCHIPLSNGVSFISNGGQESQSPWKGVTGEKPCHQDTPNIVPEVSRFSVSESLDEEQFEFSDIHSFSLKRINLEVKVSNVEVETDGRDVEEHETKHTDHEECSECVSDVSGSRSSPVAIPRNTVQVRKIVQSREREPSAKSLPIVRSQIHDLENSNLLYPLSCSLDLDSKNYEHDSLNKDILSSSKLESESGSNCSTQAAATAVDSEDTQGHGAGPINSTVELSLCKHLLFEGMGADAASRVFEINKVNLEKFSSLGSSAVKNDKLVVRIGSRYFPWDAAAHVILGMICFGQNYIFEPKGMISVDQDENKFSGNPSVPSGGSWRLWPFSSKKSTTVSSVHSVPESTTQENVDAAPMRSQRLMGHDDVHGAKFTKKVQSLTPTSEELSSLNLKEGRNVITFSFSTAMLGQQQVDALIYLWKWNTRIVISDVDGTITRSDVLGQFMPLVGKDWSQTGVVHLFSAIKENGYQFLFLSARAISQAYLTRQFLFNLKQDGKALPDGPVVISPDGLFPSLYREVIRRAPHEFKISCLEDIRALFPPECNPFYAGYGNRDTDEISYLKVGIPKGKIFIVNPKGEVAVNHRVDTKSYIKLHALVNRMFPPMSTAEQEDYNSWNYWKLPLPDIDV